jgi:hypothetical protein
MLKTYSKPRTEIINMAVETIMAIVDSTGTDDPGTFSSNTSEFEEDNEIGGMSKSLWDD